jgi:hypothetical protein
VIRLSGSFKVSGIDGVRIRPGTYCSGTIYSGMVEEGVCSGASCSEQCVQEQHAQKLKHAQM